jgi:hypothetical protein
MLRESLLGQTRGVTWRTKFGLTRTDKNRVKKEWELDWKEI